MVLLFTACPESVMYTEEGAAFTRRINKKEEEDKAAAVASAVRTIFLRIKGAASLGAGEEV